PSGEKATPQPDLCAWMVGSSSARSTSHAWIAPWSSPAATVAPSGEKATQQPIAPSGLTDRRPVDGCHRTTVRSLPTNATVFPSGENATEKAGRNGLG